MTPMDRTIGDVSRALAALGVVANGLPGRPTAAPIDAARSRGRVTPPDAPERPDGVQARRGGQRARDPCSAASRLPDQPAHVRSGHRVPSPVARIRTTPLPVARLPGGG